MRHRPSTSNRTAAGAPQRRLRLLAATAGAAALLVPLGLTTTATAAPTVLSAGKSTAASSNNSPYLSGNLTDGNQGTYWESTNSTFPQWAQVDLGAAATVEDLVLKLPTGWETRSQTLSVQSSTDGSSFSTIKASQAYAFNPASGNTVTIDVPDTSARYVRVQITANTGWPAGQLSELEVRGTAGSTDPGGPGNPEPPTGTNLALNKPIEGSSTEWQFVAKNANDDSTSTYWEGAGGQYPSTLTVSLDAATQLTNVVVKLPPASAWGPRTQTFEVQGRATATGAWQTLKPSAGYQFSPTSGNTVTVPVTGTAKDVRLRFTGNTGSGNGQVAELQVFGTAAPNPDLVVTSVTATPASPLESQAITLSAVVKNIGTQASAATDVAFTLNGQTVATKPVGGLAAGAQATVTADVGARSAGSYTIGAVADAGGTVAEQNEGNNGYANPTPLVVTAVPSSDLVPTLTWSPSNPAAGSTVTFSATIANQGNVATSTAAHGLTVTVTNKATGAFVRTLTGSASGAIAAGASSASVNLGTWTAANGNYDVKVVAAPDSTEVSAKQANNTATRPLFVGRGANLPFDTYEAEDGVTGGGATVLAPNRVVGDLAGEASGRRAVTLNQTGAYVEWTTKAPTNTLLTRFSIPDSAGGGGTNATLAIYVDGQFLKNIDLTSRYAWLYGNETNPGNQPGQGAPRHVYDEASTLLGTTVPAGSKIRLQKTAGNTSQYAIDFVDLELATPQANPNPAQYTQPAGFTHQDVQAALDKVRMDATGTLKGVYLPAGDYQTSSKFQVYGKGVDVVGAGPWFTRFFAPQGQENTDVGFRAEASANGSTFRDFAYFGNYTSRIDGPGKVFDFANVKNMTIDNIWVEHMICMFWASNMDDSEVTNSRIRNTFADAINMTNGSANNHVHNNQARGTGDDSFALFAATDNGGSGQRGNVFENLTSTNTWRAAGLAVYGGQDNTFRNIYIADTLVYSGVTISSLDFGYPMEGFGPAPTVFDGLTVVRSGGHFWGDQMFGAVWMFSASKAFGNIQVNNLDVIDPTYSGIMFQTNYVGGQPQNTFQNPTFTNVTITGAKKSGDRYDAKSGYGIWANPMPEAGQGPAVGTATFTNLTFSGNFRDIENTTSTFTITRN
ncbi:discoidin domain-containing protein [Cellulosimicrobium protaetiae]|uniref:Glycosyl hydrolase n=1 Tax=Cellulosimicrobium protaetiae TaxID=2587808 RepID=A0A6M5UE23_9MICO|nr:discoidin domain-containing protein [Cellulosimicrobium protaetiae]QJW35328.1 glycosyl hydrolase [Cellulosimicrobium protaetiae]